MKYSTAILVFLVMLVSGLPSSAEPALVKALNDEGGAPSEAFVADGTAYFIGFDELNGSELWKTDGTAEGTGLVKDIHLGHDRSAYDDVFIHHRGHVYFFADDGTGRFGRELWRTDGTEAGTEMVADLVEGDDDPSRPRLASLGERLVIVAWRSLWSSDGTAEGTSHLATWGSGDADIARHLVSDGETAYFTTKWELWRTDGTEQGTRKVTKLPEGILDIGFLGDDLILGAGELWVSDGTAEGTRQLVEILPTEDGSEPDDFHFLGDELLFTADDGRHGRELWKTDGTAEGTELVEDLTPGFEETEFEGLFGGPGETALVLTDGSGLHPSDILWTTDGTGRGTQRLGEFSGYLSGFVEAGDAVYFLSGYSGTIWRTDGTPEGTSEVELGLTYYNEFRDSDQRFSGAEVLFPLDGTIYFLAEGAKTGYLGHL